MGKLWRQAGAAPVARGTGGLRAAPERCEEAAVAGADTEGDPRRSDAALGELGVALIVTHTVQAIQAARARR